MLAGMDPQAEELVHPAGIADWHRWLAAHHGRGRGVWVVSWRRGSGHTPVPYEDLVCEALCWGWIDSRTRTLDDQRAAMWFAPRSARSTWVRSNRERVERLEAQGRMQPAGAAAVAAARADGRWDLLREAEDGVEDPLLTVTLDADEAARAGWDAATPAARARALIDLALARTGPTHEKRIARIVAACRQGRSPAP